MAAWWVASHPGWKMSYTGDDPRKAEHRADELRKQGKETRVVRHTAHSFSGKAYIEYATIYREEK